MKENSVSFIGTGLMGSPMVLRLLEAGCKVSVFNRTAKKTPPLVKAGAKAFDKPSDAISEGDIIVSMVTDFRSCKDVTTTLKAGNLNSKIWLMMGTITPEESKKLNTIVKNLGGEYGEAPVLGSIPQVKTGTLQIMFGGDRQIFNRCKEVLEALGEKLYFFGNVGEASAAKLALNQLIISLTTAFSASLGFISQSGTDIGKFMELLRDSAVYAPTFDKKLSKMESRDFSNPNFPLKHMLKDVNLIVDSFGIKGINTGYLQQIRDIIEKSIEEGEGDKDYSALFNGVVPHNK